MSPLWFSPRAAAAVQWGLMSSAPTQAQPNPVDLDPDQYRMTLGDHLEELRRRLIIGLFGFLGALVVCFIFGQRVITFFCRPLVDALHHHHIAPQMYTTQVADGFMVYMQISMICAAAIASPLILYQLWKFVAAGLYAHERKYITKYIPLSVALLLTGMAFVYWFVLPVSVEFFITFNSQIPLNYNALPAQTVATSQPSNFSIPMIGGDPRPLHDGMIWFDTTQDRLKIYLNQQIRTLAFGPANLLTPMITLPQYIDMVVGMLLAFGLAFQTPLAVLALVRVGIVDVPTLKRLRKYIFFIAALVAAVIVPDVVTGMIALMLPLYLLYELGIFLAVWGDKKSQPAE